MVDALNGTCVPLFVHPVFACTNAVRPGILYLLGDGRGVICRRISNASVNGWPGMRKEVLKIIVVIALIHTFDVISNGRVKTLVFVYTSWWQCY